MILDSNIIIYSAQPVHIPLARYLQKQQSITKVSLISTLEVLGFPGLTKIDEAKFTNFFGSVEVYPITEIVIAEAIRLRQQRKRSLGDSIIAATALLYGQPLLTNNVADFGDIPGLTVIPMASVL